MNASNFCLVQTFKNLNPSITCRLDIGLCGRCGSYLPTHGLEEYWLDKGSAHHYWWQR